MSLKCGRCGGPVFHAEERLGLNQKYHERCFTCAICNKSLDSLTLAENRELNEIFCKVCYRKKFATKGYGYGPNEPTLLALPSKCQLPADEKATNPNTKIQDFKTCEEERPEEELPPKPPPKPVATQCIPTSSSRFRQVLPPFLPTTGWVNVTQPWSKESQKHECVKSTPVVSQNIACIVPPPKTVSSVKGVYCETAPASVRHFNGLPNHQEFCHSCGSKNQISPSNINVENKPPNDCRRPDANNPPPVLPKCAQKGVTGRCGQLVMPRYPPKPRSHNSNIRPVSPFNTVLSSPSTRTRGSNNNNHNVRANIQTGCTPSHVNHSRHKSQGGKLQQQEAPSPHNLGGGEPCKRCQRPVYWAEMKFGYHIECFTCCCCGKPLESTTVNENGGEVFCKGCYRRFFGTHGCGYGIGAGTLQTP